MPLSRFSLSLLPAALLSALALAQSLPETGQLDADKVKQARYGKGASTTVAGLPATGQAELPGAAAVAPWEEPAAPPAPDWEGAITHVVVDSEGAGKDATLPLTFGQVFAPGDLKRTDTLIGRMADGRMVPLQVDVKATHADGTVRHAVISALLPGAAGSRTLTLVRSADKPGAGAGAPAPVQSLLDAGFTAVASATIGGQAWTASADKLLKQKPEVWLDGPLVTEWLVSAPLRNDKGAEHPRLSARFAVRWYKALGKARVDVTLENAWASQAAPRDETYDARVLIKGAEVYAKPGLVHFNQARWRKTFWWGEVPAMHVRHDTAYLIASRALPNYDRSLRISPAALAGLLSAWTGPNTEPMGVGLAAPDMPGAASQAGIGLLPSWGALYLLSMDKRARDVTLGTADLAGSWGMHYRDRRTGRPMNGKPETAPPCPKTQCKSPYAPDVAHQPAFSYLPYLVTGDYYHLEELEFWAMFDVSGAGDGASSADKVKGLLKPEQVAGQAWGLRTLGEAAYIAPDNDPLKAPLNRILKNNLDWYNAEYTDNRAANQLGMVADGNAPGARDGTATAPWTDDFFTAATGHLADLGFDGASRLLAWKAKFPIVRMTAPAALRIKFGEATGDAGLQPALAYAAPVSGDAGREAWRRFLVRSVKPDYGTSPQLAIVPRK